MQVTIKQIAQISGVHRSTVDKVLHNREGVSDEVRQKIKRIIDELGYKPNIIGKALTHQKRRQVIAALLLKNDAQEEIQAGIEKAYREYKDFGLEIEYYFTNEIDAEEQLSAINFLRKKNLSGLIIIPVNDERIRNAIHELVDEGIPVVTTNSDIVGCKRMCFVGQDVERAGRVAGQLMGEILNGVGKVAVITDSYKLLSISKRYEGFKAVIKDNYPGIEIVETVETYEQKVLTFQKTLALLEAIDDLNGIYITCGRVSEVGKAVKLMNKDKKVKIISFDLYPEIVELVKEGVINFTIGQDLISQGYKPVKLFFDYLFYGQKPETEFISTTVDVRLRENIDMIR